MKISKSPGSQIYKVENTACETCSHWCNVFNEFSMKQRLTELLKWGPLLHTQTFGVLSYSKGHEPVFKSWKDHLWKVNVVTLHTINPKEPWNCSFFLFVEQRPNLFNFGSNFTQILNTEIIYSIILLSVRKVFRLRIHCLLPL